MSQKKRKRHKVGILMPITGPEYNDLKILALASGAETTADYISGLVHADMRLNKAKIEEFKQKYQDKPPI